MANWKPKLWLRILLPTVLLLIWLTLAGLGGPTFGKISEVSTNGQAGFLPASAQSTEVNDWQAKFRDSDDIPAIVVVETDAGGQVADTDRQAFADLATVMGEVEGVAAPVDPSPVSVIGPIYSEDGAAVEYIVPLTNDSENLRAVVTDLRATVLDNTPAGYTAYVTGPAGLLADFINGFAGIDGILLLVALGAVFFILLIVYRALLLPVLVLLTSVFALSASILGIYWLAYNDVIQVSGQSQGILSILVIGAATDYALLMVARYREALFEVESKWTAIGRAFKGAFEPIFASAATVIAALLCLLFSDLNSNKSLGPIAAFGIGFAFLAAVTLLPTLLVIFGRAAFWPFRPKVGGHKVDADDAHVVLGLEGVRGLWKRIGTLIATRPRTTWVAALLLLLLAVAGLPSLKASGIPQTDFLLAQSQAVDGQVVLGDHFDAGSGSPAIIIADEATYLDVMAATEKVDGVSTVTVQSLPAAGAPTGPPSASPVAADPKVVEGRVLLNATLTYQADSKDAENVVAALRTNLVSVDPTVIVGGVTAIALDTNTTAQADLMKIIPIVLLVIFVILMLLLRSILAPLILIVSVVISYAAALGVSALVFNNVFNFPGADASVPLFGFVFLVALGVDYNIFLMTRVREESLKIGTRPGILKGLAVTGGVITSAGVVLAATFAALGVIPLLFLAQLAFIVSFGVILDTVIVRSLLVPAFAYDVGNKIWWPSKLGREPQIAQGATK
jgi:RND superfamily putative drug exporter